MNTLILVSSCGGSSDKESITPINLSPEAYAGVDQTIDQQSEVFLSGSGSDSDGNIISYLWTQTAGTNVVLTDANKAIASFNAPNINKDETLSFQLTVTDNDGATDNDDININVIRNNQLPTANAGVDQTINELSEVILSGSGSDSDGNIISYQWTQTAGTDVVITDENKAIASFNAPNINKDETLSFQLTVTDNDDATANDEVNIYVARVNQLPVADAGEGTTAFIADTITLNCSGSLDPDGDELSYHWQQTKGASVTLNDESICQPKFKIPNESGVYEFSLTVTDDYNGIDTDKVSYEAIIYSGEVNNWQHNHLFTYGALHEESSDFVTIEGDFAYIGSAYEGWWIADITEPESPTLVSKVAFNATRVNEITVKNNYAFISTSEGLKIFNISSPASPIEIGDVGINQGVNSVVVKGNFLYAITNNLVPKGGYNYFPDDSLPDLFTIDISTITSPKVVASIQTDEEPKSIVIEDNYAYIIDGEKGLKIIDISDSASLQILSELGGLAGSYDLLVKNGNAYIWSESGMKVVDVAIPIDPKLIGDLTFRSHWYLGYRSIHIMGEHLILAKESEINLIDISEPSSPKWNGRMLVPGKAMQIKGDIIYSVGDSGLIIVNASTIVKSNLMSLVPSKATRSLKLGENLLYATNWVTSYEFFETFDISSPNSPSFLGDFNFKAFDVDWELPIDSWDVAGNMVFIVNNTLDVDEISELSKVRMVDITDPTSPTLLNTLDLGGDVYSINAKGNFLYSIVQDIEQYPLTEFRIFDLSDSSAPALLGSIPTSPTNEIMMQGDIAYLSGEFHLQIVDVSDSHSPVLLSETEITGHINYIENDIAYIKDDENRLKLVDIANSASPNVIDFTDTIGSFSAITVNENVAYISSAAEGLKIFDVTIPSSPLLERTIGTTGSVSQSEIKNDYIYMADSGGLLTLDIEQLNTRSLIHSDQSYTLVNKSSILNYSLNWSTDNLINIKCMVTSGSCNTIINKQNKSAEVEWITPDIDGDYEIVILGGNTSSQQVIRDKVTIH